jgi:periplasmic mercuric ion binding protein
MLKTMRLAFTAGLILAAGSALAAERTVVLDVGNTGWFSCCPIVNWVIRDVAGVSSVKVEEQFFGDAVATVTFDDSVVQPEIIAQASTDAGYPAVVRVE